MTSIHGCVPLTLVLSGDDSRKNAAPGDQMPGLGGIAVSLPPSPGGEESGGGAERTLDNVAILRAIVFSQMDCGHTNHE